MYNMVTRMNNTLVYTWKLLQEQIWNVITAKQIMSADGGMN